jgi:hypothetical protein
MSGYSTYTRWQRIESQAKLLGFRLDKPKHGHWGGGSSDGVDQVALYPDGDALPVFTRDAELFTGTFRDVEIFLGGWTKAQSYDMILRMTDEKRRRKFEDAERARQAEIKKREEQKKMIEVLKSTDQQNQVAKK